MLNKKNFNLILMEKYVNEKSIIKNTIYESFKESINCEVCKCIMIEPVFCTSCQSRFCKKCKEKLEKNGDICPSKCQDGVIKDVIEKNNFIFKLKFKCIKGCGKELLFNDIKNHYSSDCLLNKKKITSLTKEEAAEYKKKFGEEIGHLTSKLNY